ncbi:MAG: GNAT family N-acetyltransferase [Firmicutes bacterium]|nr:GNAT family N-acetyltransferase [Bacillota bacterium]
MKLIKPTMQYDEQIQDFRREYLESGESMDGGASLRKFENTKDWLDHLDPLESEFLYVREEDGKVVGLIQIRHKLNEFLANYAGHIGYCVRPGERRKGYATRMLADALKECEALGICDVLVCCLADNEASRKTITKNGGVFDAKVFEPKSESWIERYWIHLAR